MIFVFISSALATTFTDADTPATMSFDYSYSIAPVSGVVQTTFEPPVIIDTSTPACNLTGLCMSGDFVTDDGGEGPYVTDAFVDIASCNPTPPPSNPGIVEAVERRCDVYQTVDWTYLYVGGSSGPNWLASEGFAGEVYDFEVYFCMMGSCISLGYFGRGYDQVRDPFTVGEIFFLGGSAGSFFEL